MLIFSLYLYFKLWCLCLLKGKQLTESDMGKMSIEIISCCMRLWLLPFMRADLNVTFRISPIVLTLIFILFLLVLIVILTLLLMTIMLLLLLEVLNIQNNIYILIY